MSESFIHKSMMTTFQIIKLSINFTNLFNLLENITEIDPKCKLAKYFKRLILKKLNFMFLSECNILTPRGFE